MGISILLSIFGCGKRYVTDGPGTEREAWLEFTISQSSDVYEQNYSYTVKLDEESQEYYLSTEVYDYVLGYPDEKSIKLKSKTVNELISLNLLSLPDKEASSLEAEILDGTFLSLSVTDQNGNSYRKSVSDEKAGEILALLEAYINKIKPD